MVLKKTDWLPDDPCIHLISQIGDTRNPRVLHQYVAQEFRDSFSDKHSQDGDREKRPDTMNLVGKEGVQVDWLVREGIFNQKESVIGRFRIENAAKNRGDHERDQTLRKPHRRKTHDPHREPYLVRLDVMQ